MSAREFVLIDLTREIVAGPFPCVSSAAGEWAPGRTFIRHQAPDGGLHLLTESERAEAWRAQEEPFVIAFPGT